MNVTTSTGDISSQRALFDANPTFVSNATIPLGDDPPTHDFLFHPQETSDNDSSTHPLMSDQHPQNINGESSPYQHQLHHHDAGCQVSLCELIPVTVIKEAKKLSLPYFDPMKMIWTSFSLKLHASLIKCDLAYLLCEQSTNHYNITHSKELMLELFKKLQGSALSMFTSLSAQQYYLEGGRGIKMI
jgi:hypothetical protein